MPGLDSCHHYDGDTDISHSWERELERSLCVKWDREAQPARGCRAAWIFCLSDLVDSVSESIRIVLPSQMRAEHGFSLPVELDALQESLSHLTLREPGEVEFDAPNVWMKNWSLINLCDSLDQKCSPKLWHPEVGLWKAIGSQTLCSSVD